MLRCAITDTRYPDSTGQQRVTLASGYETRLIKSHKNCFLILLYFLKVFLVNAFPHIRARISQYPKDTRP